MSPSLTDAQIAELKRRLQSELHRLESGLSAELGALEQQRSDRFPGGARDPGDESTVGQGVQLGSSVAALHSASIAQVRAALARIEEGSYGECVDCGGDVGLQRLLVQPSAARCLACQTKAESRR